MNSYEHEEQATFFQMLAYYQKQRPALEYIFAIPNGGARHPAVANKLKAEGVKPGVPDVFVPIPNKQFHGLFLEFKRPEIKHLKIKKGVVAPKQKEMIAHLRGLGYAVAVVYSAQQAWQTLENYLNDSYNGPTKTTA